MSCILEQDKCQVIVVLVPTDILAIEYPLLLFSARPSSKPMPIKCVEVVEYTCSIDYDVVLTIVDKHTHPTVEHLN